MPVSLPTFGYVCVIMYECVTYVTEEIEGLSQSYVQHTDALSKQLVEMLPEMLEFWRVVIRIEVRNGQNACMKTEGTRIRGQY